MVFLLNFVSESVEVVDIVYDAIPEVSQTGPRGEFLRVRKPRRATEAQKLEYIWREWDRIDEEALARGLIANALEDALMGMLSTGQSRWLDQNWEMGFGRPTISLPSF